MAAIRTLIMGGGIGGLSLARELALRGLPATVLEKTPQLDPVGAGIIMNANAMRVLEQNGLAAALRARAWPYLTRETCDQRGRLLALRDYRPLTDAGKIALGALVHRAHLHHVLYAGLRPGTVCFDIKVRKIDGLPDQVRVETDRGEIFEADLLVGADGIHSQVREQVFGAVEPVYMGYLSHRLVLPNNVGVGHFTEFLGRGKRIGLVPISDREVYVWTTFNWPRGGSGPSIATTIQFREFFEEFTDPRVRGILSQIESTASVITTEVEEIRYDNWIKERVALLGDAAHALTPNIGQGAGMAMEDGVVLAQELDAAREDRQGVGEALARYVMRRKPRVENVTRISREVGDEGQRSSRFACWLRNRRIRRAARNAPGMLEDLERLLAYRI